MYHNINESIFHIYLLRNKDSLVVKQRLAKTDLKINTL